MKNANVEYELFVKEIYEYLHKAEGVNHIQIQHNVKLEGLSGCKHQIDVYWKFEIAGVEYQVAIECKNYGGRVSIGKLRDFNSVLKDIGNINGIYVSKNGFQRGAKEYAEKMRIKLFEMRHPNNDDWEGRMRDLFFEIKMLHKNVHSRSIVYDMDWIKENISLKTGDKVIIKGLNGNIHLEDLVTGETFSLYDLEQTLPCNEVGENIEKEFIFENAYILETSLGQKIKIRSIKYTYDVSCSTMNLELRGDDIAKAIVKDVIEGYEKFVDIYGNVKDREPLN